MKPTEKTIIESKVTHRSFEKAICHMTRTHRQALEMVRGQAGVERDKFPLCFCCKEETSKSRISWELRHWTVSVCSRMFSFLASGPGQRNGQNCVSLENKHRMCWFAMEYNLTGD